MVLRLRWLGSPCSQESTEREALRASLAGASASFVVHQGWEFLGAIWQHRQRVVYTLYLGSSPLTNDLLLGVPMFKCFFLPLQQRTLPPPPPTKKDSILPLGGTGTGLPAYPCLQLVFTCTYCFISNPGFSVLKSQSSFRA